MAHLEDDIVKLAKAAVEKALANGHQVNAGEIAKAVLEAHPDTDIPITEIETAVAKIAVSSGIESVEFGPPDTD